MLLVRAPVNQAVLHACIHQNAVPATDLLTRRLPYFCSKESKPGKKTTVKATFGYSHIDRKPLGDVSETLKVLITGNPDIDFVFEYQKDGIKNSLDTKGLKK